MLGQRWMVAGAPADRLIGPQPSVLGHVDVDPADLADCDPVLGAQLQRGVDGGVQQAYGGVGKAGH